MLTLWLDRLCVPPRQADALDRLYIWLMRVAPTERPIREAPARIGIWEAMRNANACEKQPG